LQRERDLPKDWEALKPFAKCYAGTE
jgi:hypothetical protein